MQKNYYIIWCMFLGCDFLNQEITTDRVRIVINSCMFEINIKKHKNMFILKFRTRNRNITENCLKKVLKMRFTL